MFIWGFQKKKTKQDIKTYKTLSKCRQKQGENTYFLQFLHWQLAKFQHKWILQIECRELEKWSLSVSKFVPVYSNTNEIVL